MSCKLPECYPVSFDNNLSDNVENFLEGCPAGYGELSSPNPDCQHAHAGEKPTHYYVLDSKTYSLPDPRTNESAVGWTVLVNGGGGFKESTVATHSIVSPSGYRPSPNCPSNKPHALTFVDDAKVAATKSWGNRYMKYCILGPPTKPTNVNISNITANGFTASWTPGSRQTSYTYSLNGVNITPLTDSGMTTNSVTFTNLQSKSGNTFVVTAVNNTGSISSDPTNSFSIVAPPTTKVPTTSAAAGSGTTTSGPTKLPPITVNTVIIENIKTLLSDTTNLPSNIISSVLKLQTPTNVITAALANGTPAVFTALVNTPSLQGTSITIKADDAVALYNTMSKSSIIDTTKPLVVSIPSATGSITSLVPGSNTKLAIDLTVAKSYPILDIAGKPIVGYSINVVNGIQYYITPLNPTGTPIDVGTTISIPTSDGNMNSFTVADLDVVFVPAISTVSSSTTSQLQCPIVKCSESTGRCPIPYQLYGTIILGVIITTIILTVLYLEL